MLATLGLASCAGPEKAAPRGAAAAGFRPLIAGESADLDRLEKVARDCGLTDIRREKVPGKWLSFHTPARAPRRGDPFRCFLKWTQKHPETPYRFVGNEAPE